MAPESLQPPPLDPALIVRARIALNAAGLPGDAVSDEEVAGLVHAIGRIGGGMSQWTWWNLERWLLARRSR